MALLRELKTYLRDKHVCFVKIHFNDILSLRISVRAFSLTLKLVHSILKRVIFPIFRDFKFYPGKKYFFRGLH